MRRGTIRAIAAAAAAATVLTACGGGSEVAAEPEPTAPAATAPPTPEAVEETTEALEVPELDLKIASEADVEGAAQQILDFRDWLYAHPAEAQRMQAIYWSDCPCTEVLQERLDELEADGVRIIASAPTDVVRVDVREQKGSSFTVAIAYRQAPAKVLDSEGVVLQESDEFGPEIEEGWVLTADASGSYRLLGVSRL